MPIWFNELLQAMGGGYHTLAEAAHTLDNPATFAEVEWYHHHHERYAELEAERQAIIIEIDAEDEHLSSINHHMEAWGLHGQLAHLENCLNLPWECPLVHYNHCPNSCCNCHARPGGPA